MSKREGLGQRLGIIFIMLLFLFTSVGAVVLSVIQNNEQAEQQKMIQELLDKQKKGQQDTASKIAKDAFIPEGEVKELVITDLTVGTGETAERSSTVTVDYRGTLVDGTIFDSSFDRGKPGTFSLDEVIKGWQEGIPGMKVGGKRRLVIPADMAYGEQGSNNIPPNSPLVFEIELKALGGGQ